MEIWKQFENAKALLFDFINAKQVILWGYEYNAYFIEHMFKISNKNIEYIVEDGNVNPRIPITRSCELTDLSPNKHAVILTGDYSMEVEQFLQKNGFQKNEHYIYAKDLFLKSGDEKRNISYFGYLESYYHVDITERKMPEQMEKPAEDCFMYSPGIGYALADVMEQFHINGKDAVFDFGCGKGGALILFEKYGFKKYGGVEYDKQLYSVVHKNFDILGLDQSGLINDDAAMLTTELDAYNYFFLYHPFEGETFYQVIKNLQMSWKRNQRKITLLYSGPYCHDLVVKDNCFILTKKVYTDYSVRNVNIYVIPEVKS